MILILDDHPLSRQGLCSVISMLKPDEEVMHASRVRESIALMQGNSIDLVMVDLNLGKENGFDFVVWVKENQASVKIAIITSSSRQSDFIYAQELGVDAYVLKDAFIDDLMYGLRVVERGGKFYSTSLIDRMNQNIEEKNVLSVLTIREMDVLSLLGEGYSNGKIAQTLFISEGTVKKHISNILSKLQLNSRMEAMLLARSNSLSVQSAISRSLRSDLRKGEC